MQRILSFRLTLVIIIALCCGALTAHFQQRFSFAAASQEPAALAGRSRPHVANPEADGRAVRQATARQLKFGGVASRQQMDLPSAKWSLVPERLPVTKRLAPFTLSKEQVKDKEMIGLARPVELTSAAIADGTVGVQRVDAEGKTLQVIALESPGAIELRVHLTEFHLAAGEALYVYGLDADSPAYGPFTGRGGTGNGGKQQGDFWTGIVTGERVVIEYLRVPNSTGRFAIPELVHHYTGTLSDETSASGELNSTAQLPCHNDATCSPNPLNEAVGRISFVRGGEGRVCSGTMLASGPANEFAPYFLTANHCIANDGVAGTAQVRWRYRSTACNSGVLNTANVFLTATGAGLLKTYKAKDQTMLRLWNPVPDSTFYAGWTQVSWPENTQIVALHHPRGSFLRRSIGKIVDTDDDCFDTDMEDGYGISWLSGLTEPGSSGSAMFHATSGEVLGVLSCGFNIDSLCSSPFDTSYGKFSHFFPRVATHLINGDRGTNPPPTEPSAHLTVNGTLGTEPSRVYGEAAEGYPYFGKMFAFQGTAGQTVRFTMQSSQVDAYLYLLSPGDHELLAEDGDSGGGTKGTDAQITFTLPETGVYLIEATTQGYQQTGSFVLSGSYLCDFTPEANAFHVSATSGKRLIKINKSGSCFVNATSNASWLSISSIKLDGIEISLAANTALTRTGTITLSNGDSTKTITVTQAKPCNLSSIQVGQTISGQMIESDCVSELRPDEALRPAAARFSFAGLANQRLAITLQSNDFDAFVYLLRSDGTILEANDNSNNSTNARIPVNSGYYTLPANGTYIIEATQVKRDTGQYSLSLLADCGYEVTPTTLTFAKDGGTQTVNVKAGVGCAWSSTGPLSLPSWLKYVGASSGTGNGTVTVQAAANSLGARTGTFFVANTLINVSQANGCVYTVTPATKTVISGGGAGSFSINTSNAECAWTVSLNAPSGMISYPLILGSRKGNDTIEYVVNANSGAARTATFTIAGQTHTITQAAVGPNPAPSLTGVGPSFLNVGKTSVVLTVLGTSFLPGSTVLLNGTAATYTKFINETKLEAGVPDALLKEPGKLTVAVRNAAPGGGTSANREVTVYGTVTNLSAASYLPRVSADSIVAAFGLKLARDVELSRAVPLPTNLLGTTVRLRDRTGKEVLAGLFFVSPTQINYLFPSGLATGPIEVWITNSTGDTSYGEITLTTVAPSLFGANANGKDAPAAVALRVLAGGRQVYEPVVRLDPETKRFVPLPIKLDTPGESVFLILYGSGLRGNSGLARVSATLGRSRYAVAYAGAQGSLAGLDQVNLLLPPALAGSGEIGLTLSVDGQITNSVKINLQ